MSAPNPASLLHPPLLFAPRVDGVGVALVLAPPADGRERLRIEVEPKLAGGSPPRVFAGNPVGEDAILFDLTELEGGTRYGYRVLDDQVELTRDSFVTQRAPGTPFVFDLITDSHVFVRDFGPQELGEHPLPIEELEVYRAQKLHAELVLPAVAANVAADAPDFLVHLGDVIDLHGLGEFNDPPPDPSFVRAGFLDYRRLLGGLGAQAPHLLALGNWDGENGDYPAAVIESSRAVRAAYLPNPGPTTYPQGGSEHHDYFALAWGDALFVVLNVMTYTKTSHRMSTAPGVPDDWTLGEAQLAWLRTTLAAADQRWKFLLIHHTVGGAGPDPIDAAYGRGGGLAAQVGEQATVHALMREHGVQVFFYGHDHLFTDMVVDGIHYTLPGRAGTNWVFDPTLMGYARSWPDSGHARVHVSPEQVRVELVNLDREVLHAYTLD